MTPDPWAVLEAFRLTVEAGRQPSDRAVHLAIVALADLAVSKEHT